MSHAFIRPLASFLLLITLFLALTVSSCAKKDTRLAVDTQGQIGRAHV